MADLPSFESAKEGLASRAPFKIDSNSGLDLQQITDEEKSILRDALMHDSYLHLRTRSNADLQFCGEVLQKHKKLTRLALTFLGADLSITEHFVEIMKQLGIEILDLVKLRREVDISKIFEAIRQITSLTEVNLGLHLLPNEEMSLAEILSNQGLKKIYLWPSDSWLRIPRIILTDNMWHRIGELLSSHSSLEMFRWSNLTPTACVALGSALKTNTVLKTIQIENSTLQPEDMTHICDGLKQNSTLEEFEVHSNLMHNESYKIFFEILANNGSKLKTVDLAGLHAPLSTSCFNALSESLKTNTMLTTLKLTNTSISDEACRLLCQGLKQNNSLRRLALNDNGISVAGIQEISALLKESTSLQQLSLSKCLDYQKFPILLDGLKHNTTLTDLVISGAYVASKSYFVFDILKTNRTLTSLDLSHSFLNREGLIAIKNMLIQNTTLRTLDISSCFRSAAELAPLVEALKINQSLTTLRAKLLSYENKDPSKWFDANLVEEIQNNYTLTTLDVDIDKQEQAVVDHFMKRNRDAKSEMAFKVAILSRNIARSRETMTLLPREIWLCILKQLTHPGMDRFDDVIDRAFKISS